MEGIDPVSRDPTGLGLLEGASGGGVGLHGAVHILLGSLVEVERHGRAVGSDGGGLCRLVPGAELGCDARAAGLHGLGRVFSRS